MDLIAQLDFHGKAPDTFWSNLTWELWQAGWTDSIESLLTSAKERVGEERKEELNTLVQDFHYMVGKQEGSIYRGELWSALPKNTGVEVEHIRQRARAFMLEHISDSCSDYARHSLDHADRSIAILNNWLLDNEQKQYLASNEWMVFFLYAALHLQNLGFCIPPGSLGDVNAPTRAILRNNVGKRGAAILAVYWKELGLRERAQADILSKVLRLLKDEPIESKILQTKIPYLQSGKHISIQFLISCLRLVNELDLVPERIPSLLEGFTDYGVRPPPESLVLLGVGPHPSYVDTITAYIQCFDLNTHKACKWHEGHTQALLNEVNRNISPRFRFSQVIYEVENIGYESIDFRFRVETSAALDVFVGNPIYTNRAAFLRELIQNSLDACALRQIQEPTYVPQISVKRERNGRKIVVKDNGMGMSRMWVEKYFLPVGISFYRSEEFANLKSVEVGFTPISQFGVGILSCFMVAEQLLIRTKNFTNTGLSMIVSDYRNYFSVQLDDSIEQGTEISLTLRPEMDVDCLGYMLETIRYVPFPIEYIYFDGEQRILSKEPVSLVGQLRQRFWSKEWVNYVEVPMALSASEGYVAFKIDRSSEVPLPGDMSNCDVHVYQDGIYVCNEPALLPNWVTSNVVVNLNLVASDKVDLSISRVGIVRNSKYVSLQKNTSDALVALMKTVFKELQSHCRDSADYKELSSLFIDKSFNITNNEELLELLETFYCFSLYSSNGVVVANAFLSEMSDKYDVIPIRHPRELVKRRARGPTEQELVFTMKRDSYVLFLLYKRNRETYDRAGKYSFKS